MINTTLAAAQMIEAYFKMYRMLKHPNSSHKQSTTMKPLYNSFDIVKLWINAEYRKKNISGKVAILPTFAFPLCSVCTRRIISQGMRIRYTVNPASLYKPL